MIKCTVKRAACDVLDSCPPAFCREAGTAAIPHGPMIRLHLWKKSACAMMRRAGMSHVHAPRSTNGEVVV